MHLYGIIVSPKSGGGGGGGGIERGDGSPPFCMLWAFFDFNEIHWAKDFFDIHRPHPGPQDDMQIGGVRCAISQIWPKFREMLGENPADMQLFDLRLLGLWVVMNIINSIAKGVSPRVRAPPSLAAEERMLWERSTYESKWCALNA